MVTSLVRADEAFSNDELVAWLRRRLEDDVLEVVDEFETLTVVVTPDAWVEAHRIAKEDDRLAFQMFDSLFGVDAKEDGFDVVSILYSVEMGRRLLLRTRAQGGREEPSVPTVTGLFRGANWHERETWDMFGIEFDGHPGLAPRILTDENFEGWPLRKDFHLATREAKPWPGVKEPAETDEDGNVIEKVPGIGEAVGPMALDELMAEQARAANPELVAAQQAEDQADADAPDADAPQDTTEAAKDAASDDDVTVDELKAESEAVEAAALAERTASGHVDIAEHGGGDASVDQVLASRADNDQVRDPDEVRAAAAEHRAERAREIAQDGLVTGTGDGEDVPQGDPDAFGHAREPGELPKDSKDVQAAIGRGEIPDDLEDDRGVQSQNPTVEQSLAEGHSTDQGKDGRNPADDGPIGREPEEVTGRPYEDVTEDLTEQVESDDDGEEE
jgi:NADH-quinone oxidoreductase subunit C